MEFINEIEALEALYGEPSEAAIIKVAKWLTPCYRQWIMASRLCILSTVGPEGTDGSPRGDDGPVVMELDPGTLALPDWRGNNRIDSLRNIVRDPRVSLLFLVPGSDNVIRVNGTAKVTVDDDLRAKFEKKGRLPIAVIVIRIEEVYAQCSRALVRAKTWRSGDESHLVPTVGQMLTEMTKGSFDGVAYDKAWPERRDQNLW